MPKLIEGAIRAVMPHVAELFPNPDPELAVARNPGDLGVILLSHAYLVKPRCEFY